jgi:photosystem II stability/assembly factor-like uncharacterized protein
MKRLSRSIFLPLVLLTSVSVAYGQHTIESTYFDGLKARSIGPAGMSGRIADIQAVPEDPRIIYVGAATGGVWKSVNGGVTWKPLFDKEKVSSIGALAISPESPDVVWVGTGEANVRNSAGVGRGVFKTLDGGESWEHLGLEETEKVSRILLHPNRPDTAFVAALGTTWGENEERGVFKTVDGGATWEKVLYVDDRTGAADMVMDPSNPNRLLAAMWDHRRWPWSFQSGGPGSGLYLTQDGGKKWKKLTREDGLPEGELGRIGLAYSRSNPNIVYALVEAKKSALCRSEDGGKTWKVVNSKPGVSPRPFYYADIRVHPTQENTVYRLAGNLGVSIDGGKSFKPLMPFFAVHGDFQALWIHPDGDGLMYVGGDGGIGISYDSGKYWNFVQNLPLAQYYHINVDMERPYNVYGGMQDNGSWRGPSQVLTRSGIFNFYWDIVGFGDGFGTLPIPDNSQTGYSMSQGGFLTRWDLQAGEWKDVRPPAPDGIKLRFNWNAAIALDPHESGTMYYGSQFLHRTRDEGHTWDILSPDLTTDDPEKQQQAESGGLTRDVTAAENHCSIITIAPSPVTQGVIWVGTDDGNVQVTRDGGESWSLVSDKLTRGRSPSVPAGTWVPHIEASAHDAGTAYVVFDDHRRANWTTYIFVTEDYGESWKSLAGPDIDGFVHVIEEDRVDKDLLFVGTEFGLFVSFNRGESWMKWTKGVPTVPVRALVIHPREQDLVIGTHGRAAFILDDIRPLRSFNDETAAKPLHLFPVADAVQYRVGFFAKGYLTPGNMEFQGENRAYGALISYSLSLDETANDAPSIAESDAPAMPGPPGKKGPTVDIEILDAEGDVVRTLKGPKKNGMQRVAWDLRRKGFESPYNPFAGFMEPVGPAVLPGAYTIRLKLGDEVAEEKVQVLPDPRSSVSDSERREKYDLLMKTGHLVESVNDSYKKVGKSLEALGEVLKRKEQFDEEQQKSIGGKSKELKDKLQAFSNQLTPPKDRSGIFEETELASRIMSLAFRMDGSFDAPTQGQRSTFETLSKETKEVIAAIETFMADEYQPFVEEVEAAGFSVFPKE